MHAYVAKHSSTATGLGPETRSGYSGNEEGITVKIYSVLLQVLVCNMSRRGRSCSKRRLPPMPTAKELGELERLKQNEVSLKSKIRSVSLRKMLFLATLQ